MSVSEVCLRALQFFQAPVSNHIWWHFGSYVSEGDREPYSLRYSSLQPCSSKYLLNSVILFCLQFSCLWEIICSYAFTLILVASLEEEEIKDMYV